VIKANSSDKRTNKPCVRLTDDELKEIKSKAKTAEMSLSEYMRQNILGREMKQNIVPEINRETYRELAQLRTELQKQGTNINQLTKFAHIHQQFPDGLDDRLSTIHSLYEQLEAEIKMIQANVIGLVP
jgi:DNA repair exonuclease SbcCD ATPase subunit